MRQAEFGRLQTFERMYKIAESLRSDERGWWTESWWINGSKHTENCSARRHGNVWCCRWIRSAFCRTWNSRLNLLEPDLSMVVDQSVEQALEPIIESPQLKSWTSKFNKTKRTLNNQRLNRSVNPGWAWNSIWRYWKFTSWESGNWTEDFQVLYLMSTGTFCGSSWWTGWYSSPWRA